MLFIAHVLILTVFIVLKYEIKLYFICHQVFEEKYRLCPPDNAPDLVQPPPPPPPKATTAVPPPSYEPPQLPVTPQKPAAVAAVNAAAVLMNNNGGGRAKEVIVVNREDWNRRLLQVQVLTFVLTLY